MPLHACLVATISSDVWGVRRELLPWLQYHTELGVARFYVSAWTAEPCCVFSCGFGRDVMDWVQPTACCYKVWPLKPTLPGPSPLAPLPLHLSPPSSCCTTGMMRRRCAC